MIIRCLICKLVGRGCMKLINLACLCLSHCVSLVCRSLYRVFAAVYYIKSLAVVPGSLEMVLVYILFVFLVCASFDHLSGGLGCVCLSWSN